MKWKKWKNTNGGWYCCHLLTKVIEGNEQQQTTDDFVSLSGWRQLMGEDSLSSFQMQMMIWVKGKSKHEPGKESVM